MYLCIALILVSLSTIFCNQTRNDLESYIYKNYDVKKISARSINIFCAVDRIIIHEQSESMKIQVFYLMSWKDELISWKKEDFSNISKLFIDFTKIWSPKFQHYNNGNRVNANPGKYLVRTIVQLNDDGNSSTITQQTGFDIEAQCIFNFDNFPNDVNNCTFGLNLLDYSDGLVFKSFADVEMVKSVWAKYRKKMRINNFKLIDIKEWFPSVENDNPKYLVTFTFKRYAPFVFATFTMPTINYAPEGSKCLWNTVKTLWLCRLSNTLAKNQLGCLQG
ncbi:unnamed protein product [Caenorhabditis angaria]|uniref:Neurotransmitter-gated ion-channel ligand-binding domain-containing protein n=1 Tax=Caenorhabditis angaria TaxID=860376 RepID=A0A9P1NBF7_9PELO|nr:unnamed protein product [Caenorhabditis angaria]